MTQQEFQAWLEDPSAIRCILVEVEVNTGVEDTILYISNKNYATQQADTPSNQNYLPILSTSVDFTENLPIDSTGSLSYGDLSLNNTNGEYDHWFDYIWSERPINIFIGDVRHARAEYTNIFSGIVSNIVSSGINSINIQLRDKLQRLNTSIYETTLGEYGTRGINNSNKDEIRPLVFGEVSNITPLLVDEVELEFMVHDGPIERIIEVRDNGVPVLYTANLNTGTFKLTANPVGTITCSVQGDIYSLNDQGQTISSWPSTVAKIVQRIVTGYGNTSQAVEISEIDLDNFNTFNVNHPQQVGIYISSRENLLSVCQNLCDSIGAQLVSTKTGQLKLLKVDTPVATASSVNITEDHILQDSFELVGKPQVIAAVKLGYCYNYTVQEGMLTGIPEEHKAYYSKEWLIKSVVDTQIQSLYKLSSEAVQQNTLLLSDNSGYITLEADRRLALRKTQRYIYSFTCSIDMLKVSLGEMVLVTHRRFGLTEGKPGQVISVNINWDTGYIKLEVLV